jgi:hypothetical protein
MSRTFFRARSASPELALLDRALRITTRVGVFQVPESTVRRAQSAMASGFTDTHERKAVSRYPTRA